MTSEINEIEETICHFVDRYECFQTAEVEVNCGNYDMEIIVHDTFLSCEEIAETCKEEELKVILTTIMKQHRIY